VNITQISTPLSTRVISAATDATQLEMIDASKLQSVPASRKPTRAVAQPLLLCLKVQKTPMRYAYVENVIGLGHVSCQREKDFLTSAGQHSVRKIFDL
jgi:hypothetical protein